MEFKVGDKVKCVYKGMECTSNHLKVGDEGKVITFAIEEAGTPREYLVDFITSDGYKRQWVYAHSIEKVKEERTLEDRVATLEKRLDNHIYAPDCYREA